MRILLPDNTTFDMNVLPDMLREVDDRLKYCVLDYSNTHDVDFYWIPIAYLEQFSRPAADLQIGRFRIQMPLDWSIVIADANYSHLEIIELQRLNDRDFEAFVFNPIRGFMPHFGEIVILNTFPDVTWNTPKLKYGHILAVPLEDKPNPACAFFVKDTNRLPDILDISKVFC